MQAEASALIWEKMPIQVKSQRLCESNDHIFAWNPGCLHLIVEMRRCKEQILCEEVVFKGKFANLFVHSLDDVTYRWLIIFLAIVELIERHHG